MATPEQEAINQQKNSLRARLFRVGVDTVAELRNDLAQIRDDLRLDRNPFSGNALNAADKQILVDALRDMGTELAEREQILQRAETIYQLIDQKNLHSQADPEEALANLLDLLEKSKPRNQRDKMEGQAYDIAVDRFRSLLADKQTGETLQNVEGDFQIWQRYKQYRSDRAQTSFDANTYFANLNAQLAVGGRWTNPDVRPLFEEAAALEDAINNAIRTRNFAQLVQLEKDVTDFIATADTKATGVSETTILSNRIRARYELLLRESQAFFDINALEASSTLTGAQLGEYTKFLGAMDTLQQRLEDYQQAGRTEDQNGEIKRLWDAVKEGELFLTHRRIPDGDKILVRSIYERLQSEVEILLGEGVDERQDIYTEDVKFWMEANHSEAWHTTSQLWAQYQKGNMAAFSPRDWLRIDDNIEYFKDAINRLTTDQNDVAFAQRFTALDIQLNRLLEMKEAKDKVKLGATDSTGNQQEAGTFSENQRIAIDIYKKLRERNPLLPEFEKINTITSPEFLERLSVAIAKAAREKFNITTSSAGSSLNLPSSTVILWKEIEFDVTGTVAHKNLEFFFGNFPWEKVYPHITEEKRKELKEMWELRLLHISLIHNTTSSFHGLLNQEKSKEHAKAVVDMINAKGADGGFYGELEPFYDTYFKGKELADVVGDKEGIDRSWPVPQLAHYFLFMISKYAGDFQKDSQEHQQNLKYLKKNKFIPSLPPKYKDLDPSLIDMAWDYAWWRLHVLLKVYDFDDSALASKIARPINFHEYGPKVGYGMGNTDDVWSDTMIQRINRVLFTRSEFIHFYCKIEPGVHYDEIHPLIIKQEIDDLEKDVSDLEEKIEKKTITDPEEEEYKEKVKEVKLLKDFLLKTKIEAGGTYKDITDHYKVIRFKPGYTNMKLGYGLPIAVPLPFFEDTAHPTTIALSEEQIIMSGMSHELVDWGSFTRNHGALWAKASGDMLRLFEIADLNSKDNAFTPVSELDIKPLQKINYTDIWKDIRRVKNNWITFFRGRPNPQAIDRYIRDNILIPEISVGDLVEKFKFALVTKTTGRYAMANMIDNAPYLEGKKPMKIGEMFVKVFRQELAVSDEVRASWLHQKNTNSTNRLSKVIRQFFYKISGSSGKPNPELSDFIILRNTKNQKLIKSTLKTPVPKAVRESADRMMRGDTNSAENQMILETFIVVLGATLDKFMPKSIAEGKPIKLRRGADIETVYEHQVKETVTPGLATLNAAQRELIIMAAVKLFEDLQESPIYKGGTKDGIFANYNRETVENMMRSRGIMDTIEQAVTDEYFVRESLGALKSGVKSKDEKKAK